MEFKDYRTLVADDDEVIRETLLESLETMGFEGVLLRKPFTYQTLLRKIEAALLKQESRKTARNDQSRDFCEYTLVEEIARGGAGVVWRAHEKKTGETVALKILLAGSKATDEQILRFHREANTVSELRHRTSCRSGRSAPAADPTSSPWN